jgi:hypothetical protein
MERAAANRRAFTLVIVPLVLGIILVVLGLMMWKAGGPPGGTKTASSAYNAGRSIGPFLGAVFFSAFWIWIASALAEKRSEATATFVCGGILLLANVAYGINTARAYGLLNPIAKQGGLVAGANGSPTTSSTGAARAVPPQESETSQPTPPRPPTFTPESTSPGIQPQPKTQENSVQAPEPVKPVTQRDEIDPRLTEALGELRVSLQAELRTLKDDTDQFVKVFTRLCPSSKKELAARKQRAESLEADAKRIGKKMFGVDQLARDIADKLGVNAGASSRAVMEFSQEFGGWQRSSACDGIARLAQAGIDEVDELDRHFGHWRIEKGKYFSKERAIESSLGSKRFFLDAALDRKSDLIDRLGDLGEPAFAPSEPEKR